MLLKPIKITITLEKGREEGEGVGKEENREGLKLDMLMEDKKEEGRIAKEREKEIRKYLIQIWENKKKKKQKKEKGIGKGGYEAFRRRLIKS